MSKEKETPESVTLGAGAPGDPARMEAPPAPPMVVAEGVAYEKTDVAVSPILRISAILAAVTVLSAVASFGVFRLLGEYEEKGDPKTPPLSRAARRQFPEPRLQALANESSERAHEQKGPAQDLASIQEEQRRHLASAAWVDEAQGVARIPIDDAITLAAQRMSAEQPLPLGPAAPVPSPLPSASPSPSHAPEPPR